MAKKNLHVPQIEKLRSSQPLVYEAFKKIIDHVNQQNQQQNTNQGSK